MINHACDLRRRKNAGDVGRVTEVRLDDPHGGA